MVVWRFGSAAVRVVGVMVWRCGGGGVVVSLLFSGADGLPTGERAAGGSVGR